MIVKVLVILHSGSGNKNRKKATDKKESSLDI
jgi:hypothetical protein